MDPLHVQGLFIVQLLCHAQLFATPWTAVLQASLSSTGSQSLLKFMSIGDASHPLLPFHSPFAFSLSQYQSLFH